MNRDKASLRTETSIKIRVSRIRTALQDPEALKDGEANYMFIQSMRDSSLEKEKYLGASFDDQPEYTLKAQIGPGRRN